MHKSVLLEECLDFLNINDSSIIVDCTLGYGGHSSEILKLISNGHLYAFDQDIDAITYSDNRLKSISSNYTIIKSNFKNIKEKLHELGVDKVDGILYDLGVSSPQLDVDSRGFSFHKDARLDMRMDKEQSLSAYEVVNEYSKEELTDIIFKYGEERFARNIARAIVENRPITTTLELVEVIKSAVPMKYKIEHHPARKTFQAIRIEVNKELDVFRTSLIGSLELIKVGGRICVITFHSLEDKICKEIFNSVSKINPQLKSLPVIPEQYKPKYKVIKTIKPSEKELDENNRSRSAKLRVIERIG